MSRTLLHDWECSIEKNKNNTEELLKIAEDIYNTAYARGKASEERPKGEWEEPFESNGKTYHKCNYCHISSELILIDKFCPNCGARMKEGAE